MEKQLPNRSAIEPPGPRKDRCRAARIETLDRLRAFEDRPLALEPFDRLFRENWREEELQDRTKPVVGQLCNFIPEEIILAAGAIPMRLDSGCPVFSPLAEQQLPTDVCCAVRSIAGEGLEKEWPFSVVDLLVVPTACDGKKKIASILSSQHKTISLDLPQSNRGDRAISWWLEEIYDFIQRLQKLTGRKLHRGSLREAILLVNRRSEAVRRMNLLRKENRIPIHGHDAFLVMQASFLADTLWWVEKTEALVRELEQRIEIQKGFIPKARLLLTGSPVLFPDYKLLLAIADAQSDVVADEMCSASQGLHHPTVIDEWTKGGLIRAVAERTLLPCTCPCFVGGDGRRDRLIELAESFAVDGVVHHTLRLCQLYDLDAKSVAKLLQDRGLPWINIYSELSPEESGGMQNRVDAFVEMIAGKRA